MNRLLTALGLAIATGLPAASQSPNEDLVRMVGRMTRIGSASSPSFSPDGRRIAFVSNMSGLPQIWIVDSEGGWPDLVTGLDDPVGFVSWSPDGSSLAFTLAPGGGMNEQVYLVRPDGTHLQRLTRGGRETNRLGAWSGDGKRLSLGSNTRTNAAIDNYVYDVSSGETRLVTNNQGTGGYEDLTHGGSRALLNRLVSRGDNNLFLVDVATARETLLTPHEPPGSFSGRFSPDGRSVYLATDKGRDLRAFGRVVLDASGAPGAIEVLKARDDAELSGFEVDRQGTTAALLWNAAGRSELELFDLKRSVTKLPVALPAEIAGGLEFSRDGRRLALTVSGAATPSNVWTLDTTTGALKQITRVPHPGVDVSTLARPTLVTFRGHDGEPLSGWLYRPVDAARQYPTVLSFHGGPEGQERPAFNSTYQALLSRGIGVFAPNVRGSSGFGKRFVNLDNGALRANGVRDIKACVDAAIANGADPKRLGIMGGSYGGYMTMAGLGDYPELFAAGANLFGVVNFETFFKHTEPWMAAISTIEYGDPATQSDLLRRLSPIHKVDRIAAPTLVLHGANDTNVPVVEAEQVVESLKRRGVPVEYVLFPDEGHGFRKLPNRVRATLETVRWFETYLRPAGGTSR